MIRARFRGRGVAGVALALVSALVVAGCGPGGDDTGADRGGAVERTVEVLADAGIAVFEEPDDAEPLQAPAEPVSPVQLLSWQVLGLAGDLDRSAGRTAAELDALIEGDLGEGRVLTASMLITEWAGTHGTPAARYAQEALAPPSDWPEGVSTAERPVFSDLLLLLFVSDMAVLGDSLPDDGAESGTEPDADARSAMPHGDGVVLAAAGGTGLAAVGAPRAGDAVAAACTGGIAFLNSSVAATFDALQKLITPPPVATGFGPFDKLANAVVGAIVGAENVILRAGQFLVNDVLIGLTVGQVMHAVATISGFVGMLTAVTNLVKPWTADLEADPDPAAVALAPAEQGEPGKVTATVRTFADSWPAWMESCATAAGRPLPSLRPSGYPMSWDFSTVPAGLATVTDAAGRMSDDASGVLDFRTAVQDVPDPQARLGLARTTVYIERDDARRLAATLAELIANGTGDMFPFLAVVPPIAAAVQSRTRALAEEVLSDVLVELQLIQRHTQHVVHVVTYYEPGEEPTEEPTLPASPPHDPTTRTCPLLTFAEVESITGIAADELMVLLPGDVVEGMEVPFTSCTFSAGGGEWQVIALVHRGPEVGQMHSAFRADAEETHSSGSLRVQGVPGPWDDAFTFVGRDQALPTAQIFAVAGEVRIEAQILYLLGGGIQKHPEATALAEHLMRRAKT